MNVIFAYLETMFGAYPSSPRLLEAKTELRGMMEDAYTSLIAEGRSENEAVGQVIRDFGNLEEVAPALGITSDIARAPEAARYHTAPQYPSVTLKEAQGYADAQQQNRFRFSTAVMLFVLSPSALIALPVTAESGLIPITDTVGVFIGLLALLVMIAGGVMLLVTRSRETAPYKRITEGHFVANPEVTRWVEALSKQHERARIKSLQIAITLWILAPIPLIAFAFFLDDSPRDDFWTVIGVVIVLVVVAIGLWILLPQTWAHAVAEDLSRTASDNEHSIINVIAAFYWPLLTAIFLAWSFIGDAWDISWIIWPIGAVLFGAIAGGGNALERYRRSRQ
ncbi:hypothetical protein C3B59_05955 [Cryobacterium zongtaii]|uniref:Uncharacterized protein n=1 Tax=Cryobacterium zongtaii TaxID=1259217 RepID=A0A2S3ZM81_9MICO|nr:permease prefix domain 1-containing protein [Cryobacterium zongtaii]POH69180.1 hypothetical protein C3B59_05955 [Cryobacterium zongtaii]